MTASGIEFITRADCPLCDSALRLVALAAHRRGIGIVVVDVDEDATLLAAFDERVPVVRDATTGEVLAEGAIGADEAARAVARVANRR